MTLPHHGRLSTHGPDGRGDDRFLISAAQLNECIADIVGQLTSLHHFAWDTEGVPLPRGAFDALATFDGLTLLHIKLSLHRCNVQMRELRLLFTASQIVCVAKLY